MHAFIDEINAPIGQMITVVDEQDSIIGLHLIKSQSGSTFLRGLERQGLTLARDQNRTALAGHQLREYFAGDRQVFDLPLAPKGTPFQQGVWRELAFIPFGETRSYGEVADAIGHPGRAQEIGAACAANPILLMIPCHRVVAADGSLRGYAAGLHIKEQLLAFEQGQRFLAA